MKKLTFLPLVAATFFMVSGGPYGLEELVQKAGYRTALLAIVVTPLLWSLPTALLVGELASALPEEGGYYAWVRRALGPALGFQEAWLSLAASFFDMAIYPILFASYVGHLWSPLAGKSSAVCLGAGLILACTLWNLRGARAVGGSLLWLGAILFAPFLVLCTVAAFRQQSPLVETAPTSVGVAGGILVAMWNYMGWDNASTVAAEVEAPQRTYPRALLFTVVLVALSYALPVLATQHLGVSRERFSTGAWASIGASLVGPALGTAVVVGGAASAIGSFNALLLSCSRLPLALARDGLLPSVFARTRGKAQVPVWSVVTASAIYTCCLGLGFSRLILLDVFLYGLSLALEFVALIVLRVREPDLARPFRVPVGVAGLVLIALPPMACLVVAFRAARAESTPSILALGVAIVMAGPLLYRLLQQRAPARVRRLAEKSDHQPGQAK